MKICNFLIALLFTLFATAQNELDFDMDVSTGTVGGYINITYTITNISTDPISNLVIDHPDAVINSFTPTPSTLTPGASLTATGKIAIGEEGASLGVIFGSTQASINGLLNGNSITELSDGQGPNGFRVEDGPSFYQAFEPHRYGVIYIDVDLNGRYDFGIDNTIVGAVINIGDQNGNTFSVSTNETGWWNADIPPNFINTAGDFIGIVDQNSFPIAMTNYPLVTGTSPFPLAFPLAASIQYEHGYADGNTNFGLMRATAFLDENNNGSRDATEIDVPYTNFEFIANNDPTTSIILNNGTGLPVVKSDRDPGTQLNDINATLGRFNNFYNIATSSFDDIMTTNGVTTELEFAVIENSTSNRDTAVYLASNTPPNPGFDSVASIVIDNTLNGVATGTLQFTNDSRATILSVIDRNSTDLLTNGTATTIAGSFTIPYNINNFGQQRFRVNMSTPINGVQIGDTFTHMASINPTSIDNDASNNTATLNVDVVASYDPNDVTEARGEIIPINTFSNTDYLEYTIRFQNLGTASAQFVRVLSTLDPQLDPATFEMITTSHNITYTKNASDLDWFFDDIQLAPEVNDPEASNGFIRYRIKPLPGFAVGDLIAASASIFFDYNPPVITETWLTTFDVPASLDDIKIGAIYPIPLKGNTLFFENIATGKAQLYSLDGKEVWSGDISNSQLTLNAIDSGFYILKVTSEGKVASIKLLKE
jgi:hypothetical protein